MTSEYYSNVSDNSSFLNDSSFMNNRINPEPLLKKVENFLSGKRKFLIEEKGKFSESVEEFGEPLANKKGINNIMNKMFCLINAQIVQGNIKIDMYYTMVSELREDFAIELMYNSYDWGIEDKNLGYIADTTLFLIEGFLTRLVDNKEREGYAATTQSREVISPEHFKKKRMLLSGAAQ